ncbi:MAG: hypothetical protein OCD01_17150 [Fibrobacterales bacterium]
MKKALLLIASTLVIFTGCITSDDSSSASSTTQTNPELEEAQAELDSVQAELESVKSELNKVQEEYDDAIEDDADCKTSECKEAKTALDTKESEVTEVETKVDAQEKEVKETEKKIADEIAQATQNSGSYSNSFSIHEEYAIESYTDQTLITMEISDDCIEEEITYNYTMDNGELIIETEDCERITYTGSNATVIGDWTFKNMEFDPSISYYCDEDGESDFGTSNVTGTMTITESKMTINQTVAYNCLVDAMTTTGSDDVVKMEKVDCNTVGGSNNGFDSETSIDISQGYMSVVMSQSYKGTSCEIELSRSLDQVLSIEQCEDEQSKMEAEMVNIFCILGLNQTYCSDFPEDQGCNGGYESTIETDDGDDSDESDDTNTNTNTNTDTEVIFPQEMTGTESASCEQPGMMCVTYKSISSEYKDALKLTCGNDGGIYLEQCPSEYTDCADQTILGNLTMQISIPPDAMFTCEMMEQMQE